MPQFKLEDIEDYYSYYVLICGISEELFWTMDLGFLRSVCENKAAYDGWLTYVKEREYGR